MMKGPACASFQPGPYGEPLMTARRLYRRAKLAATLGAAVVLLGTGGGTAFAQQPSSSYRQRAAIFDPGGQTTGRAVRPAQPTVRQRPATAGPAIGGQRSGTYENRSIPKIRQRTRGGGGGVPSMMGMGGMGGGRGMPGIGAMMGRRGGAGRAASAGTYGGARPR
jgi:hypothetical protein